nr:spermidine synthase [Cystobacter sp.]
MTKPYVFQHVAPEELHAHLKHRSLLKGKTAVQSFEIAEVGHYGRALLLEGCVQSTEHDERIYHESLLFPAYAYSPRVASVLCLGGANGGTLKQILKLPHLERVRLFDIDPELHGISRRLLPHMHERTLEDPRVRIEFGKVFDMVAALGETRERFDLIVADLPDATAESYATSLFSSEFYQNVSRLLSPHGIYVTQAGQAHFLYSRFLNRTLRTLGREFAHVTPYTVTVPSYGCPWAFALASRGVDFASVTPETLGQRIRLLPEESLAAYDEQTHAHMFHLPKILRSALAEDVPVNTLGRMETVEIAVRAEPASSSN